jgi:hypothetical protein
MRWAQVSIAPMPWTASALGWSCILNYLNDGIDIILGVGDLSWAWQILIFWNGFAIHLPQHYSG